MLKYQTNSRYQGLQLYNHHLLAFISIYLIIYLFHQCAQTALDLKQCLYEWLEYVGLGRIQSGAKVNLKWRYFS